MNGFESGMEQDDDGVYYYHEDVESVIEKLQSEMEQLNKETAIIIEAANKDIEAQVAEIERLKELVKETVVECPNALKIGAFSFYYDKLLEIKERALKGTNP